MSVAITGLVDEEVGGSCFCALGSGSSVPFGGGGGEDGLNDDSVMCVCQQSVSP